MSFQCPFLNTKLSYAIQLYIEVLNKEEWLVHFNSKVKRFCIAKKLHDIAKLQLSFPLRKRINNLTKGRKQTMQGSNETRYLFYLEWVSEYET